MRTESGDQSNSLGLAINPWRSSGSPMDRKLYVDKGYDLINNMMLNELFAHKAMCMYRQ